jgi:MraZ protein
MVLLGEFEATVDGKNRFLLPVGLRKQLPEGEDKLVLGRGLDKCLTLYPTKAWEEITSKLLKLNDFDPKVRDFKTKFLGGATIIELDSAGRVLIPQTLKAHAEIDKEIMIVCDLDKIKIWDSARYKMFFENNDTSPSLSDLAKEIGYLPN